MLQEGLIYLMKLCSLQILCLLHFTGHFLGKPGLAGCLLDSCGPIDPYSEHPLGSDQNLLETMPAGLHNASPSVRLDGFQSP